MPEEAPEPTPVTRVLAARAAHLTFDDIPEPARRVAKQCLLDWIGVAIGGRDADLVGILSADAEAEGTGGCTVIGHGERRPAYLAALINGAMGHALDYDDVIFMGHPTAPVAPAVLAAGEQMGATGRDVLTAFVAGFETECRVGRYVGGSHYAKGWHSTATLGTFGAAAAAGRLIGLDPARMRHALGLAATQAAGLKSMFGTMTKPLHAGNAATSGLRAARLARLGFTANPDAIECLQGFGDTQSASTDADAALADPPGGFHVVDTLFKYHAACYLTHSAIEAAVQLRASVGNDLCAIERATIRVDPGHLTVCNIAAPETGLACKFSLRMTAAMALAGEDTSDEQLFSDATAQRPDLIALRDLIDVSPTARGTLSKLEVVLKNGRTLNAEADVAIPMRDLGTQQERLARKFTGLARPFLGQARAKTLQAMIESLEDVDDISSLTTLLSAAP